MITKKTILLVLITSVIFLFPFILYFIVFRGALSLNDQNWSNFGSFIGGIGATIFSFASFISVIYTYNSQKEKQVIDDADKEKEKIEAKLLDLIELLNNSRSNLFCEFNSQRFLGIEVITRYNGMVAYLSSKYSDYLNIFSKNIDLLKDSNKALYGDIILSQILEDSISSYSNTAMYIIAFISKAPITEREGYFSLLISQLSNQEKMCLLVANMKYFEDNNDILKKVYREDLAADIFKMKKDENELVRLFKQMT